MENVVIVLILLVIAAGIIWYLIRAKKNGAKMYRLPLCKKLQIKILQ